MTSILKACGLPLDYLNTLPKAQKIKVEWINSRKFNEADIVPDVHYTPPKPKTLRYCPSVCRMSVVHYLP